MKLTIDSHEVHVATGGKAFDASLPTVVLLAGSGGDHRTWALQARWFAFHGYAVLAPDFPAHSLSAGTALTSIEDCAAWTGKLLDAAGVQSAHFVGHSQGFLAALEFASHHPDRVKSLTGIGTAAAIPVNPALIETAEASPKNAAAMMVQWGFGPLAHRGLSATPGMQPVTIGFKLMSSSPLADDLKCCAAYQAGEQAIERVVKAGIPCSMILAGQDKMTPIKSGKATAAALGAKLTVIQEHGHMLPLEAPREVLQALQNFISNQPA